MTLMRHFSEASMTIILCQAIKSLLCWKRRLAERLLYTLQLKAHKKGRMFKCGLVVCLSVDVINL